MKLHKIAFVLLLCISLLSPCGKPDDPTDPAPAPTQVVPSPDPTPDLDWEKELTEYLETAKLKPSTNAVVHTGQSGVYMELSLQKGSHIDVLQKRGYTFEGYETKDGVQYVDSTGKVTKEYIGNNKLLLKASFLPEEFTVRFFLDGQQSKDLNSVIYFFDEPLDPASIHLGKELNGTCVIGFEDGGGNQVISADTESISIKDLGACVDYDAKTVDLHAITIDVALSYVRKNTYQINDNGFLKQSLDSKGTKYDSVDLEKETDIGALKALGYTTATIHIECSFKTESGKPQIKVLKEWPKEKKDIKNATLSNKNDDNKNFDEEKNRYYNTITIPMDELGSSIYVAYNTSGVPLKSDGWKSDGVEVKVSFSK